MTNPGNIRALEEFFKTKTIPKNEVAQARDTRHKIIELYLRPRVQNRIKNTNGRISFRNPNDVYKFLKGMYIDILHDAKSNSKSKNPKTPVAIANANMNVNANANSNANSKKVKSIDKIIAIVGNFDSFIDEYFGMIFSMNTGRGADILKLKSDVKGEATIDNNFLTETGKYFTGKFEHKWKRDVFNYTGYTDTGIVHSTSLVQKYGASINNPRNVYYDMETTGDISRKLDIDKFPLVLTVPGASDAGIMVSFALQPYKYLTKTIQNINNIERRNKLKNNTYQRTLNEIGHIRSNLPKRNNIRRFLRERVYNHMTVPPRTTPKHLAKYIVNFIVHSNTRRFTNWTVANPIIPENPTILDFRDVMYEYTFYGISIYRAEYHFDPSVDIQKQSLEKKFIQSCRVKINGRMTDPIWSSGPLAWKHVAQTPKPPDAIMALLRKESMDRSVYTLALLNNAIHVTGDLSAVANRALLYKIYGDVHNKIPAIALFDNGTGGLYYVEPSIVNNRVRLGGAVQLQQFSNNPSAELLRTAYVPAVTTRKRPRTAKPVATLLSNVKPAPKRARVSAYTNESSSSPTSTVSVKPRSRTAKRKPNSPPGSTLYRPTTSRVTPRSVRARGPRTVTTLPTINSAGSQTTNNTNTRPRSAKRPRTRTATARR